MDWNSCKVITFDCYGTLVDWESGITGALAPVLERHGVEVAGERLLARYAHHEEELEAGPYLPYRAVLTEVVRRLGRDFGFDPDASGDADVLAESLPEWPLFPDTAEGLQRLRTRYRLGVLSNVDDDLFAGTHARLGVELDWVVTAGQVGSYKPARANFEALLERIEPPAEALVHAAQSLFHDVVPARALGLKTVWVDRRGGRSGGATPATDATPDLRVPDLATLVEGALGELSRR